MRLITIITVCYNASKYIEETILSVINQTYSNIEYIIIDGGSSDGTLDIIKKYQNKIHYWISEPDKGIYDAMNKGIKKATGEWINFMNCGDSFYDNHVITNLINKVDSKSDVIYGNTCLIYSIGKYIDKGKIVSANNCMPFGHQASFTRNTLMKQYGFDLKYKICADYNFFHQLHNNNATFEYIDIIIANYEAEEGLSSANVLDMLYERGRIEGKNKTFSWNLRYNIFKCKRIINSFLKSILPQQIVLSIKRYNLNRNFNLIDKSTY